MDAMRRGDVEAVVEMLSEDAAWSMPPLAAWFGGREMLRGFLTMGPLSGDWRWSHAAGTASGQAAVGSYTWQADEGAYLPFALDVLTLDGTKIKEITSFIIRSTASEQANFYLRWPEQALDAASVMASFERFGLPGRLD